MHAVSPQKYIFIVINNAWINKYFFAHYVLLTNISIQRIFLTNPLFDPKKLSGECG